MAGVVVDALEGPPYSYLQVRSDSGLRWVAVPIGAFSRGDRVSVVNGALVRGLDVPVLQKRFEEVTFGTLAR